MREPRRLHVLSKAVVENGLLYSELSVLRSGG